MRQTRFGAPWSTPASSSAILRAIGSARGVKLRPVDELSLAACVVAAHIWCTVTARESLAATAGLDAAAISVSAAILSTACGYPADHGPGAPQPRADSSTIAEAYQGAQETRAWLQTLELCPTCVMRLACQLLASSHSGPWQECAQMCAPPPDGHTWHPTCLPGSAVDGPSGE